ncbi:MAG: AAA family ATPase [Candidatus Tectomicrobia bacterium]|uniref:AAA family ATPase n=1 Tax=Tectimicrobiota bacterium TaxID=2528274 RepID=A0A932MPT4_UNCTE|nr:AAA family ATPase [Candidatus Tectomicrobia bacterium]
MRCPRCQAENREGRRFCAECGVPLALPCPSCGFSNEPGEKFCGGCGQPLGAVPPTAESKFASPRSYTPKHLAEKILTSRSALEGERKQVTVFFCDIANSTPLAERLGPEAMHALLSRFFEMALDEVHRYEGTLNQFLGDGFMALFGAPLAHEDHAREAILAALGIQRALREGGGDLGLPSGEGLALRMGLNTGFVVVGKIGDDLRMDYTAVGDTTNVAARLMQGAEPGGIVISETTHRPVAGYFHTRPLGALSLKGKGGAVRAWEVISDRSARTRLEVGAEEGLTPFVGRERELRLLAECFEKARAGHGQVVFIVGEPGIGKSRLLLEFRRRLGEEATWLEGHAISFGRSIAFHPLTDLLKRTFRIEEGDTEGTVVKKIEGGVLRLGDDLRPALPYLRYLLSVDPGDRAVLAMDPQQRRGEVFGALRHLMLRASEVRPQVVVYEDLHWMDKATEEYLLFMDDSIPASRVLRILSYRPGYAHPFGDRTYHTRTTLDALPTGESVQMAQGLLAAESLPEDLKALIVRKAEGNPFFVEEVVKALREVGAIQRDGGGYVLAKRLDEVVIPDTIQDVIMARIDRLDEAPKKTLQVASVIGREFTRRLLDRLAEVQERTEELLRELKAIELIYEKSLFPERAYMFKHALTQDVAYNSLLLQRRKELHRLIGLAIEELYAERLAEQYEVLAHHFSKAEEPAKAVEYLTRSAEKAAGSYAHSEAATALEEALTHAERLPVEGRDRRFLELIVRRAESLHFLGRRQQIVELLLQHRDRLERLQDPALAGRYYFWLGWAHAWLGHRAEAAENLSRSLQEATRSGDEALMGRVHRALCLECTYSGRPMDEAVAHGRKAVSFLERTDDRLWLSQALFALSYSYYYTGDFDSAVEVAARLDALGEATGDRRARAEAAMGGLSYATRGDCEAGIEVCQRALEFAPDPFETAFALACLGKAYSEAGDAGRAVPTLEQAVELADRVRSLQWRQWFRTWLGEAYRLGGQLDRAREVARQTLEVCTDVKYLVGVGFSHQVLGRIALAEGDLTETWGHLQEALRTFAAICSRFEQGRTHLDLAALAHAQGKRETVAVHLKEARSLFMALRIPKYVERTEVLARELGLPISG